VTRLEYRHQVVADEAPAWLRARNDVVIERQISGDSTGAAQFDAHTGPFHHWDRTVTISDEGNGRYAVDEVVTYELAVPVWGVLFRLALRHHLRRPPSPDSKPPWWAPPEALTARAATVLSLLCVFAGVAGYLGTVITQTLTYAAAQFDASTSDQGQLLASVRIGVLLSLAIIAVADRRGRRIVVIASVLGACVFTALGALSPNMWWLGTSQTFARALATVIALLVSIIAVEEMPSGARAFAISVLTMAAALGAGLCVANLLYFDTAVWAWRIAYVVPLIAIVPCLRISRQLPESKRFTERQLLNKAKTNTTSQPSPRSGREINWRRFGLLACAGFLWSLFLAPAAQFLNEFLRTERGFSGALIALFVLATNTPGGIGIVLGGKLADRHGRRFVGAIGIAGGVTFTVISYLSWGWPLWMASVVATTIGAIAIPALAVYGPELFPTSQRGKANGGLQVFSVAGSSIGLLLVGWLADRMGGLGQAMAVVAIAPAILIVLVLLFFPETTRKELEELNPTDQPL